MKPKPRCDFCDAELQKEESGIPPHARNPFTDNIEVFWNYGVRGRRFDACDNCAEKILEILKKMEVTQR